MSFGIRAQLRRIKEQILEFHRLITAWHRSNEMSMRLDEAPDVGPVPATAVVATVADPKVFRLEKGHGHAPSWPSGSARPYSVSNTRAAP